MVPELYICPFCKRAGTAVEEETSWFRSDPKPTFLSCSACKERWYEFRTDPDLPAFIIGCDAYEELRRVLSPDITPFEVFIMLRDGDAFTMKSVLQNFYPELIEKIDCWLQLNAATNPWRPKLT